MRTPILWTFALLLASPLLPAQVPAAGHAQLVAVEARLRAMRQPAQAEGRPDYRPEAIAARLSELEEVDAALDALAEPARRWPRPQQVDFLVVRGQANQLRFELTVARPWARDPGFHVDPLLRAAFVELPASGTALAGLRARLARIGPDLQQARILLTDGAGDYARLALRNLEHADGVGHGHPWRATPPAGVIGWYQDLAARARAEQPELLPDIRAAQAAIVAFRGWLAGAAAGMTAPAGVGQAHFDWYLRQVARLPWDSDQLAVLGQRELARLTALLALERHRNRDLPQLEMATSQAEYNERIAEADRDIRAFIRTHDMLTVPDAEIYLRRLPGYGLGYLVGKLQMDALLADRSAQLGADFELKAFHDEIQAAGLIPIALLRYQLTGLDDEVADFWRQPRL